MHVLHMKNNIKAICLGALGFALIGCGSGGGGSNGNAGTPEGLTFSLSLTSIDLSTTPGGATIDVNGLPVSSKQLLLQDNVAE